MTQYKPLLCSLTIPLCFKPAYLCNLESEIELLPFNVNRILNTLEYRLNIALHVFLLCCAGANDVTALLMIAQDETFSFQILFCMPNGSFTFTHRNHPQLKMYYHLYTSVRCRPSVEKYDREMNVDVDVFDLQ